MRKTKPEFTYNIEVAGGCQLRCPSCPRGNYPSGNHPDGFMSPELFSEVLEKITRESPGERTELQLYNWSDPLLHPQLPRLIRIAKEKGFQPAISTNLVTTRGLRDILRAGPQWIRLSLSGLSAETYGLTHYPGKPERFIENCRELSTLAAASRGDVQIYLFFHKYLRNMTGEYERARQLAAELGFDFHATWAVFSPLEKILAYYNGQCDEADQALIDMLALHPGEAREIALQHRAEYPDCKLRAAQTTIDFDGRVALCCMVYDQINYLSGNFLNMAHAQIQKQKYQHALCRTCMNQGADIYGAIWLKEYNEAAMRRVLAIRP